MTSPLLATSVVAGRLSRSTHSTREHTGKAQHAQLVEIEERCTLEVNTTYEHAHINEYKKQQINKKSYKKIK